jgi:hypothetical protein
MAGKYLGVAAFLVEWVKTAICVSFASVVFRTDQSFVHHFRFRIPSAGFYTLLGPFESITGNENIRVAFFCFDLNVCQQLRCLIRHGLIFVTHFSSLQA